MRVKVITLAITSILLLMAWISPVSGEENEELKPVLLVIDVQNIWMPMMAEEHREAAPEKINELIALFREYEYPVIRVYHSDLTYGHGTPVASVVSIHWITRRST